MLIRSQPLNPNVYKKLGLDDKDYEKMTERIIISQHIGKMLDDLLGEAGKRKIGVKTRLGWKLRIIKDAYNNLKHLIRNHIKWHSTISRLRPWDGFNGLIKVMMTHLSDYIEAEEKYGHSDDEYKEMKIATAKETVELLKRIAEPDEYIFRRRDEVERKYPDYKSLITKYECGSSSFSGKFIAYENGWVGKESGNAPRKGYFYFINGMLELVDSPNEIETERLLEEIEDYQRKIHNAYNLAEADSDLDFARLALLFKDNLYSWWD